jgi:hypothetical protein
MAFLSIIATITLNACSGQKVLTIPTEPGNAHHFRNSMALSTSIHDIST